MEKQQDMLRRIYTWTSQGSGDRGADMEVGGIRKRKEGCNSKHHQFLQTHNPSQAPPPKNVHPHPTDERTKP